MDNLKEWSGKFGKEYTDRNQYDFSARVDGFFKMIPKDVEYVLEIGSNYGNNLAAIESLGMVAFGIEPNEYALGKGKKLMRKIIKGDVYKLPFADNSFDLVLTCGLLIHIPPEKLNKAMGEIYRVSKKYILIIEYMGKEGMKEYRGLKNMLWKREDYQWKGTKIIQQGELGKTWDYANWSLCMKNGS